MIPLTARTTPVHLGSPARPDVWRVSTTWPDRPEPATAVVERRRTAAGETAVRLSLHHGIDHTEIDLPPLLHHLNDHDIVTVAPDGRRVSVLWKATARHNSLLLTEQCDNYCLMCSQPPKTREDDWLYQRAKDVISLLPDDAGTLGLTGGEPTLNADALLDLLDHTSEIAPQLSLHLLSNGRRFADPTFAADYADVDLADIMVGIPLYGAEPTLHDYVVQAPGAFTETLHGILNLASFEQQIELRVVIQRHTAPALTEIATFIARNLPFVDQIALMGLEMTGLARPNAAHVWIDPYDYQQELIEAVDVLVDANLRVKIYNHQLCVLPQPLWPYAVQSISDWKNDFAPVCQPCKAQEICAGVFTTSHGRHSRHLKPFVNAEDLAQTRHWRR